VVGPVEDEDVRRVQPVCGVVAPGEDVCDVQQCRVVDARDGTPALVAFERGPPKTRGERPRPDDGVVLLGVVGCLVPLIDVERRAAILVRQRVNLVESAVDELDFVAVAEFLEDAAHRLLGRLRVGELPLEARERLVEEFLSGDARRPGVAAKAFEFAADRVAPLGHVVRGDAD
jgi:hypothetical protein